MRAARFAFAAAFALASVAHAQGPVSRIDMFVTAQVRRPALVASATVRFTAKTFDFLGGTGVLLAGGGLYVAGRASTAPRVSDMGLYTTEAILAGTLATGVLKSVFGRARPFVSSDTNPGDFGFGRGWRNESYRSLPSGHTTAAFAFASAAVAEGSRSGSTATKMAGPWLYAGATLVGLTRIYQDKHWFSDVVLGAVIGVVTGKAVVSLNHWTD